MPHTPDTPRRGPVDWRRAEFRLAALGLLGFVTLPIRVATVGAGLPAHPLFVHIPVVLIPFTVAAAFACMIRTGWFERYGVALTGVAIATMSSIFLTMQAGGALEDRLALQGRSAQLIAEHAHAAHILAVIYIAFTAMLIIAVATQRISGGRPTGLAPLDRLLGPGGRFVLLRALVSILAVAGAVMVYRVGDLGARAVWQGQLTSAADGGSRSGLIGRTGQPRGMDQAATVRPSASSTGT